MHLPSLPRPRMRSALVWTPLLVTLLAGCSAPQTYGALQNWQRAECGRRQDAQDAASCRHRVATPYDDFARQRSAAVQAEQTPPPGAQLP